MIEFACPHCRTMLSVGDDQAGGPTRCRRCRQLVQVPGKAPPRMESVPPATLEDVPIVVPSLRVRMGVGGVVRVVGWGLCVLWTGLVLYWYARQEDQAETVFQQFKLAAEAGLAIVAGYIVVRAVEGITRAFSGQ
jgi:hypothetical protein